MSPERILILFVLVCLSQFQCLPAPDGLLPAGSRVTETPREINKLHNPQFFSNLLPVGAADPDVRPGLGLKYKLLFSDQSPVVDW